MKNYITRFNTAAVRKQDPTLVHIAIIIGVRKGIKLYISFTKTKPGNLSEFYKRADKYLRFEASKAKRGASSGKTGNVETIKVNGSQAHKGGTMIKAKGILMVKKMEKTMTVRRRFDLDTYMRPRPS